MGVLFAIFYRAHHAAIDARRRSRAAAYLAWSLAASVSFAIAFAALVLTLAWLWAAGLAVIAAPLAALCAPPVVAPWLIRRVLVPRGLAKAAYFFGRVSGVAGTDPTGYALVVAAWAVAAARREVSPATVAWVQARRDARGVCGDAEVVATALLTARAQPEVTRELLRSTRELAELHPAVRELAGEWLAVDAVERGAWDELRVTDQWPASPLRFLLEGIAARPARGPSLRWDLELWTRWLLAPRRGQTFAIVRAAAAPRFAAGPTEDADADADPAAPPAENPLAAAVELHVALARRADLAATCVSRLAARWDAALSAPATAEWLTRRAAELGAPPHTAERALRETMESVAQQLCETIAQRALAVPPLSRSAFGQLLTSKLRHGRLDELELSFERWAERVSSGVKLRAVDEWREFLAVRAQYRALVASAGHEVRRLAFPRAFEATNRVAVVLWNERDECVVAHAILAWQLDEARAVGDSAAIEIAAKNASLRFSTRTGQVGM